MGWSAISGESRHQVGSLLGDGPASAGEGEAAERRTARQAEVDPGGWFTAAGISGSPPSCRRYGRAFAWTLALFRSASPAVADGEQLVSVAKNHRGLDCRRTGQGDVDYRRPREDLVDALTGVPARSRFTTKKASYLASDSMVARDDLPSGEDVGAIVEDQAEAEAAGEIVRRKFRFPNCPEGGDVTDVHACEGGMSRSRQP